MAKVCVLDLMTGDYEASFPLHDSKDVPQFAPNFTVYVLPIRQNPRSPEAASRPPLRPPGNSLSTIPTSVICRASLMQTLYLMATDMGLGGCAIGIEFHVEGPVGQFAIGCGTESGAPD
jgi:nitroreductase